MLGFGDLGILKYWNIGILEYWNIGILGFGDIEILGYWKYWNAFDSHAQNRTRSSYAMAGKGTIIMAGKGTIIMEPISIGPKAMLWGLHLQPVSEISATMILEYDHLFFLFIGGLFAIAYLNLSACSAFESGRFSKSTKVPKGQIFSQPYFSYIW
ncbi:MAG: hypothetical protein KH437_10760 [Prevotella sp.]|nr:hypothetical protein [Prevotella sp.]